MVQITSVIVVPATKLIKARDPGIFNPFPHSVGLDVFKGLFFEH